MNKLIAAVVASVFVLGSTAALAADAKKRDELTNQERVELRQKADRLVAERARNPEQAVKSDVGARAPESRAHKTGTKKAGKKAHRRARHANKT